MRVRNYASGILPRRIYVDSFRLLRGVSERPGFMGIWGNCGCVAISQPPFYVPTSARTPQWQSKATRRTRLPYLEAAPIEIGSRESLPG